MSEKRREELDPRAREAVDACIRAVTQNARTQLVSVGPVEQLGPEASVVTLQLLVESGSFRRCRCHYDHHLKLANIVD
ncbi:MAG: hypothetical protein KatS3mg117_0051 [Geminicoccaceae bacterium]|jgi:hypothetical protein|nr:MAG: hypothetical protein KatS3mg117_0051 [Geminicoccaceae bacterium]